MALRRRARLVLIAWITAAAALFGALSPTVAGMLYAGRADVSARMLGLQAEPPAPGFDVVLCRQDGTGSVAAPERIPLQDHGKTPCDRSIYCSFCLVAASLAALPSAAAPLAMHLTVRTTAVPLSSPRPPLAWLAATRLARAPPLHA